MELMLKKNRFGRFASSTRQKKFIEAFWRIRMPKKVKKLNLPFLGDMPESAPILSMEGYVEFIQFMHRHVFDEKTYWQLKKERGVSAVFKLRTTKKAA